MGRRLFILMLLCFSPISLLRADATIQSAQQALKDQGFYYGEITGRKDADTTAAVRRYQIRNGLKITGELDAETQRSLGMGGVGSTQRMTPPEGRGSDQNSDLRDSASGENTERVVPALRGGYDQGRTPFPPGYGPGPHGMQPAISGVFDATPYEVAPPDLQLRVITGAQILLARRGYYRSGIDGLYGPGMEFALRAFQSRMGLPLSGRLDMQTLAALGLLPGQHIAAPERRVVPRPVPKPVFRRRMDPGVSSPRFSHFRRDYFLEASN